MEKKKVGLHIIAMSLLVAFVFLALGSAASNRSAIREETDEGIIISSQTTSRGAVQQMPPPETRRFTTLGLVFATSTTRYDSSGKELSSQEGIVTMLLKEAQRVGGEDILNLRVDENVTYVEHTSTSSSGSEVKTIFRTVTYTGSALAIKYVN
jgi:hypothetical protein